MPLEAVLLDLDGTVLDTHELILSSWWHVRAAFELEAADDLFLAGMGRPLEEVMATVARAPDQVEDLVSAYRAHNALHHDRAIRPFPGMAEAIVELRRAGVRVGIVTSKTRPVAARGLEVSGIEVDLLVGPKDAPRPKPSPDPVLLALARLEAAPGRALMVGDSPHDLVAGRAAGVATAAVGWTVLPRESLAPLADHWLEAAEDLLRLGLG